MKRLSPVLAILGLFLISKLHLFHQMEYTADFFSILELTRSWYRDGTFMFEPVHGFVAGSHSFYILLLFYPFTYLASGYGLIFGYFLLVLLSAIYANKLRSPWLVWGILISPVGYWLFDHPLYGFHVELLYIPLGILFATALALNDRRKLALAFAGIVLVKEDAPVFLWSLTCAATLTANPLNRNTLRRVGVLTVRFALFFALAMALLIWLNRCCSTLTTEQGRVENAVSALLSVSQWGQFKLMALGLFGSTALMITVLFLAPPSLLGKALPVFLVTSIPLVLVNLLGSVRYQFAPVESLTWPPRMATLFALAAACVIFEAQRRSDGFRAKGKYYALQIGVTLILQVILLREIRSYSIQSRLEPIRTIRKAASVRTVMNPADVKFAECVASAISTGERVLVDYQVMPLFARHKYLFPYFSARLGLKPDLALCLEKASLIYRPGCLADLEKMAAKNAGLQRLSRGKFTVLASPVQLEKITAGCGKVAAE